MIAVDPRTDRYGHSDAACSIDPASVRPGHATVSFDHGGKCELVASSGSQARSGTTARSVTQTILIPRFTQSISFTSTAPDDAAVGGGDYTVSATAQGGGVVFSTTSDACTVSPDPDSATVHFVAGGSCVIEADQSGGVDYVPANAVSQTFDVAAAPYELKVEATPTLDGSGNPQRIDVLVSGLPAHGTAVLSASGPDDLHLVRDGQHCPCTVTGPSQTFQFQYNTQRAPTAELTFSVATTDSPDVNPDDDTVTLDFPTAAPPKTFALRLQG